MPGITVTQACKSYETSHYTVKAVNHANLSAAKPSPLSDLPAAASPHF